MIGSTLGGRIERRWVFYGLACLCLLMFSIDMTIVSVALRTIVEDLDTSLALAAWTMTGFMLTQTVVLPLIGKLGERFGQMRVFITCVSVFTLGSLLCGLAPTLPILVIFRVIQGLTGGVMMPLSQSVMLEGFPPHERGRAMGFWSVGIVLAPIMGPVIGGYLTLTYSWRWVFYVNVPVGVLSLVMLQLYVFDPPYIQRRAGRIDYCFICGKKEVRAMREEASPGRRASRPRGGCGPAACRRRCGRGS